MADRVVLDTPRWKGEFPLDFQDEPLTALEWRWVKKISGYMPMTVEDGMAGLDPDLFLAFAVIALHRAGKIQKPEALAVADVLADLPADGSSLKVVFDDVTADEETEETADPPAEPAATPEPEQPEQPPSETQPPSSGTSSPLTSALRDADQRITGTREWERSAV